MDGSKYMLVAYKPDSFDPDGGSWSSSLIIERNLSQEELIVSLSKIYVADKNTDHYEAHYELYIYHGDLEYNYFSLFHDEKMKPIHDEAQARADAFIAKEKIEEEEAEMAYKAKQIKQKEEADRQIYKELKKRFGPGDESK